MAGMSLVIARVDSVIERSAAIHDFLDCHVAACQAAGWPDSSSSSAGSDSKLGS